MPAVDRHGAALLDSPGTSLPTLKPAYSPDDVVGRFLDVSARTEALCEPLEIEDYGLQAMPEVSPAKWHLAHTAWYFETFVLGVVDAGYQSRWPAFRALFNSYYNGVGAQYPRPQRGLLSRPTVAEVLAYRHEIRDRLAGQLARADCPAEIRARAELGLHHEQQHQELLLTDLKYCFSVNPLTPAYRPAPAAPPRGAVAAAWLAFPGGVTMIGHPGDGFCFDNEQPAHRVLLAPYRLAAAPVSNGEFIGFIEDGGYRRAELWLSDGWAEVQAGQWRQPLYWRQADGAWQHFTLHGMQPLDPEAPVAHLSYFEADAYARWAGARLPTEAEWEHAARERPVEGNFLDSGLLAPAPPRPGNAGGQFFGDVWEWTASSYAAYPGYRPFAGELGEYNGKFMCNQFVLRGGSCLSPGAHLRPSYRNFFYPRDRWQVAGLRLARDGDG